MTPDQKSPYGSGGGASWEPDAATIGRSRIAQFINAHGMTDIAELHGWAIEEPDAYWRAVVDDLNIRFTRPFSQVVDYSAGREFPQWFVGGEINVAYNCVERYASGPNANHIAIVWESESGERRSLTFLELHDLITRFAEYLLSVGVAKGDRIVLFVPMIPEAVAAFFACARIGAIAVPTFSGYGADALSTRLTECGATVLVTADGFRRRGRIVEMVKIAERALATAAPVRRMVVIGHLDAASGGRGPSSVSWSEALDRGAMSSAYGTPVAVTSNDPLMIIYTSGTTGRPKGIVLSHGGFLVKAGHDFGYSMDVQADDIVSWISDFGWLMGPLTTVGTLMFGATVLLYEGVPDYPGPERIWEVVKDNQLTILGVSPTAIRSLASRGAQQISRESVRSLRAFASSGEPWNIDPWRWLFEGVGGGRIPIINYSGGTEIGGGILTCYPILPIQPCAFSGPVIGMDVDVVDKAGDPVRGSPGELVIRNTWPGMTHGFWKAPERYLEAYWSQMPGTWVHGDIALIDSNGYWYVQGRSDDVLKLAGKRVGPAEVESAIVSHPRVQEAAAIGVPDERSGEALVCFVVTTNEYDPEAELEREIQETVTEGLGKALAPSRVVVVRGLPKTRSGKIVRRLIRARYLNLPLGDDLSSLEDPDSVNLIPSYGDR